MNYTEMCRCCTLKNGEEIVVTVKAKENFKYKITVTLFYGGMTIEYDTKEYSNLNDELKSIINDIENDYEHLKAEYADFEYRAWCD